MNISGITKDELDSLFKIPCELVNTTGTEEGVIVKFSGYYLKIYDDEKNDGYYVQGYYYHNDILIFHLIVKQNKLREFANLFTSQLFPPNIPFDKFDRIYP